MTQITLQNSKVVLRDDKVGTEQNCCCDGEECEGPCGVTEECNAIADCTCGKTVDENFQEVGECLCGCCVEIIEINWGTGDPCQCPESHRHIIQLASFPYIGCGKFTDCCSDCEPVTLEPQQTPNNPRGVIQRYCEPADSPFDSGSNLGIPGCSGAVKYDCGENEFP